MANDSGEFIGLVADSTVMGYRNPAALTDRLEPFFIRAIRREVVAMSFDLQTCGGEDLRKLRTQVAVGEEYKTQAARS